LINVGDVTIVEHFVYEHQHSYYSVPAENPGEKIQNLRKNCAENALKLRATFARDITAVELKNPRKIAKNLHVNVLWLRRKVFLTVLFKKYSTVTVIQLSSLQ